MSGPRRKAVLLVIDGLGDLPNPALGGRTPLEAARTPILDRMAALGACGLADPLAPGEIPNTDSGVGLLMGLDPEQTGRLRRGPVEAAGAGRTLREGEVAVRANFATLESVPGGMLVRDRRAGRIDRGTGRLADALNEISLGGGVEATFVPTDQHRGVLVLSGAGLDPGISDTDPGDHEQPAFLRPCRPLSAAAEGTARRVNEFIEEANRKLRDHPVNRARAAAGKPPATGVVTRGAGAGFRPRNTLAERGIRAATVAGCTTVRGLSRMLGWKTVVRPTFTATEHTDLPGKVDAALQALEDCDLVFVHVKGTDICAHDRQPAAKRDFLERLDSALAPLAKCGAIVALASDHTTDSNSGAHTADPVPVLLFDPADPTPDPGPVNFSEKACRRGSLARTTGAGFLDRLVARLESSGRVRPQRA